MNKYDYINQYQKTNYDRIILLLPKGAKDKVKRAAAEKGVSMNACCLDALRIGFAKIYGADILGGE